MISLQTIMGWFSKKEPKKQTSKFSIGDFVIIIPPWVDDTRLVKIEGFTDFGPIASDGEPVFGHVMLYSPLAWDTLLTLTPLQRLALYSESLLPIHETDFTLNYMGTPKCSIADGVKELADEWYLSQPINQIELIEGREIIGTVLKAPNKRRRLKRQASPKQPKSSRVVSQNPEI